MQDMKISDLAAALAGLAGRLEAAQARGDDDTGRGWIDTIEQIAAMARGITAAQWDELAGAELKVADLRATLRPLYGGYLRTVELEEARALVDRVAGPQVPDLEAAGGFAADAYARVSDMFDIVDFSSCGRFVMVGAGPLPVTLLHVMQRTRVPELVGLDVDAEAIETSRRLFDRLGYTRIRIEERNGIDYDFGAADVIYVANLVSPKSDVLGRVADTSKPGVDLILRNPFAAGHLFAEDGTASLDGRLSVLSEGRGNARFLSRHVFLRTR